MSTRFAHTLLNDPHWRVVHRGWSAGAAELRACLAAVTSALAEFTPDLAAGRCLIAVGQGGLDYFFFTLVASALRCRVVLCDPKLLSHALTCQLDAVALISTRPLLGKALPVLVFNWQALAAGDAAAHGVRRLPVGPGLTAPALRPLDSLRRSAEPLDAHKPYVLDALDAPYMLKPLDAALSASPETTADTRQAQLVFMTSGTTGTPKLVLYDEAPLWANARLVGEYLAIQPGERVLCLFPVHYMYGFSTVMSGVLSGATVHLERASLTPQEVLAYLTGRKVRYVPLIRSLIERLCDLVERSPGATLEHAVVLNASDRLYVTQMRRLLSLGAVVWNNFGQTESGPRLFALKFTPADLPRLAQLSCDEVIAPGRPVDSRISIELLDPYGQPCAPGQAGVMHYRTPYAMAGYLRADGSLEPRPLIDSGDLMLRGDDGVLYWVGRKDETLKANGMFINPGLLHRHFDRLPGIAQSYFLADTRSSALSAFIAPAPHGLIDDAELRRQIIHEYRQAFPLYPRLVQVHIISALPLTRTGKVCLARLRAYLAGKEAA
ncbi:AMP-binding protein [Paraburkholderia bonniea]|uniref:class I adenylate-forming enzyme family protein n=1 Tax=Paraburkholderia bonniea TaxID=2152891 RepID=UPI0025725F2F|nr:AMP-binding protein [Paraburkholderia bonniea]WJF91518.1 AMP-binding protein [Paraburkholderia bonniea]WJF94837.1 AMP-binding protein [Paraburkholderia bonniea]